jgi:tetratricopeptide (TPR) repeat protein
MAEESAVLREIQAAVEAPDLARAVGLARQALADGREHPLLLNLRAYWLEQQGRAREALADLERARTLAPEDALVANALGLCLARLNRFWDAREAFHDASNLQPDLAPAHFNLGWVSEELGLLEEARHAFVRAEQLDPASAAPPARLAYLAARSADIESARRHATRSLGMDPSQFMAQFALATCDFEDRRFDAADTRLRGMLADGRIGPLDRGMAMGLLGDCLDASGRMEEAFAAYSAANNEFRSFYAPRFSEARSESVPAYLLRIATYFATADAGRWKRRGETALEMSPVAGHVFVVGFPRSGTTLLEEVLASHPLVCTTGERDGLDAGVREFLGSSDGLDRLSKSDTTALLVFRERYWRKLRELGVEFDGKVLVDKQPYNTVKLPLIAKLFPEARILFVTRDPRDVAFSCFRRRFRMNPSNYELLTLAGAARLYDCVMRLADIFRTKLPMTVLDLQHEDMVSDFRNFVDAVFRFVGLNARDAGWNPADRTRMRAIATPSATQIARGLSREGMGSWRRYSNQLAPILPVLQPWIERYGVPRH